MRVRKPFVLATATVFATLAWSAPALAQAQEPVLAAAQREKAPLLDTLKDLVSIDRAAAISRASTALPT